jgi:hypothetical protein
VTDEVNNAPDTDALAWLDARENKAFQRGFIRGAIVAVATYLALTLIGSVLLHTGTAKPCDKAPKSAWVCVG